MNSSKSNYPQKFIPPYARHWGLRFQHRNSGVTNMVKCITPPNRSTIPIFQMRKYKLHQHSKLGGGYNSYLPRWAERQTAFIRTFPLRDNQGLQSSWFMVENLFSWALQKVELKTCDHQGLVKAGMRKITLSHFLGRVFPKLCITESLFREKCHKWPCLPL